MKANGVKRTTLTNPAKKRERNHPEKSAKGYKIVFLQGGQIESIQFSKLSEFVSNSLVLKPVHTWKYQIHSDQKSYNLQYNMLCCWVDRLIDQVSEAPSTILID